MGDKSEATEKEKNDKAFLAEIKLSPDEVYRLTEIKILQEIENKFFNILIKRGRIWGITIAIAAFIAGIFGVSSFWAQIHSFIQSTAKAEVDQRLSSEFPRLETRIDETFKSGILAKSASEKGLRVLDDMTDRLNTVESLIKSLQIEYDKANTNGRVLQEKLETQQQETIRLETILKGWFKNAKSDSFNFQTPDSFQVIATSTNGSKTMIAFLLSSVPIEGSLRLQYGVFAQPPGSYGNRGNVAFFKWGESLDNLKSTPVYASYVADVTKTNVVHKLEIRDGVLYGDTSPLMATNNFVLP